MALKVFKQAKKKCKKFWRPEGQVWYMASVNYKSDNYPLLLVTWVSFKSGDFYSY